MEQQQFTCLFKVDQNCLEAISLGILGERAYGQESRQNAVCEPMMSMNFCYNVHTFHLASRTMKHIQEPCHVFISCVLTV